MEGRTDIWKFPLCFTRHWFLGPLPKKGRCFLLIFLQCFTISLINELTGGQINHWKNQQASQETKPLADIPECMLNRMRPWKNWWWENPRKSPWQCLCLTAYKEGVFQGIDKKLVTVLKILKRSFKWDQSGISSFIRSKVMSKTSEIKRMEEKFIDLENRPKSP